ncbi:MAG: ATPase/protein kinase [Bacteroidia bacterium]|nr:MAG: ATPase/protein kinase [Bacteroidia bacterium]
MLLSIEEYVEGILQKNISVLSRAITIVESNKPEHQELAEEILKNILPHTGKSFRLGITGMPGVGKSTFIESFGLHCINNGHKIAVLAIDPSSQTSKGSILGDKTRMEQLSKHPNAFIRPSPSGGILGGVASKTYETMLLCEAAGYDWIFVETVGVGQSETEVANITDFFLLLILAASGDEMQGIKRGIMELADGIAITKADGDNLSRALLTAAQFKSALHYFTHPLKDWTVPVLPISSLNKEGLDKMYQTLLQFQTIAQKHNFIQQKRQHQQITRFKKIISDYLLQDFFSNEKIQTELNNVLKNNNFFPHRLAAKLIQEYKNNR